MITDSRPKKIGRITLKLKRATKGEATANKAEWFFRNFVRLQRIINKRPPFQHL